MPGGRFVFLPCSPPEAKAQLVPLLQEEALVPSWAQWPFWAWTPTYGASRLVDETCIVLSLGSPSGAVSLVVKLPRRRSISLQQ